MKKKTKEMSETETHASLEAEFIALGTLQNKEIQEHLDAANAALSKAIELSEKNGIPFYSNISFIAQKYTPRTFQSKFGELDMDSEALNDFYNNRPREYSGWEHSAVCY